MATITIHKKPWYLFLIPIALLVTMSITGLPVLDFEVDADDTLYAGQESEVVIHPFPSVPFFSKEEMHVTCTGPADITVERYVVIITPHLDAESGSEITLVIAFDNVTKTVGLQMENSLGMTVNCSKESMRIYESIEITLDVPNSCLNQDLQTDGPDFVEFETVGNCKTIMTLGLTEQDGFDIRLSMKGTCLSETVHIVIEEPLRAELILSDEEPSAGDTVDIRIKSNIELKDVEFKTSDGIDVIDGRMKVPESASNGESIHIFALAGTVLVAETDMTVVNHDIIIDLMADGVAAPGGKVTVNASIFPEKRASELSWSISPSLTNHADGSALTIDVPDDFEEKGKITIKAKVRDVTKTISMTVNDPDAIHISHVDGLRSISESPSSHYVLDSDIDASELGSSLGHFSGVLDGCGHVVSGFSIISCKSEGGATSGALFSSNSGIIRNLEIQSADVTVAPHSLGFKNSSYAAVLAAKSSGTISNVTIKDCLVWGENDDCMSHFYGAYGYFPSYGDSRWKTFCTYDSSLRAENKVQAVYVGGLVAYNSGVIEDCDVKADVSAYLVNLRYSDTSNDSAKMFTGMVAGYSESDVTGCASGGTIDQKMILQHTGLDGLGFAEGLIHTEYKPGAYIGCGKTTGNSETPGSCSSTVSVNSDLFIYAPVYIFLAGADYSTLFSHISYTNTVVDVFD